jgi:hypothetical protein
MFEGALNVVWCLVGSSVFGLGNSFRLSLCISWLRGHLFALVFIGSLS